MHGMRGRLRSFAASTRMTPSSTRSCSSMKTGSQNPKLLIEAATSLTCAAPTLRTSRDGSPRSAGTRSTSSSFGTISLRIGWCGLADREARSANSCRLCRLFTMRAPCNDVGHVFPSDLLDYSTAKSTQNVLGRGGTKHSRIPTMVADIDELISECTRGRTIALPIQKLRQGVDLVVVFAVREGEVFDHELINPGSCLGQD